VGEQERQPETEQGTILPVAVSRKVPGGRGAGGMQELM